MTGSSGYIPGIHYSGNEEVSGSGGNLVVDIGNPADRDRSGNVSLSGTIINRDTREPVAGVTVYIPKLS
jgi:hypothetical protein